MDSAVERSSRKGITQTPEEIDRERKKDSLLLSRRRVIHDIENAHHERHKELLRAALAHLDHEIELLG